MEWGNIATTGGHVLIIVMLAVLLKKQGVKFDIRLWWNGKDGKG